MNRNVSVCHHNRPFGGPPKSARDSSVFHCSSTLLLWLPRSTIPLCVLVCLLSTLPVSMCPHRLFRDPPSRRGIPVSFICHKHCLRGCPGLLFLFVSSCVCHQYCLFGDPRGRRSIFHKRVNPYRTYTYAYIYTRTRTATRCNTLQHTATHCNALQRTATHCNALEQSATH